MGTALQLLLCLNVYERINDTLKDWKENDDKMFINTRAAQYVLKCIKENNCVTITASSGVGKTATLRHVALQMAKEEFFDVLLVTDPADIVRFCNPKKKTLFVVDDLCGNFSLDQSDIKSWEPTMEDIKKSLDEKQTKILAACRLQVFQDGKFDSLSVFKLCVCNMLSENICLTKNEKQSIAKLYLNEKALEVIEFSDLYECFPLLCKLYYNNPKLIITDFFQNPFSIYEAEIDKFLKKGHHIKYCALALCVIFNNKLKQEMLTEEVNKETRIIIENTCEACRLDRGTSRLVLQDELDSLIHTFIKKEQNMYKIIHDKIFDFLVKIYGQNIIYCLIKNADSNLIKERFLLESKGEMDQFITIIPQKYHQMFIQRMIYDWSKGKVQAVFSNINMKNPKFTQKFLSYLNTLDTSYQRRLANICDEKVINEYYYINDKVYDTALFYCCYIGDLSLVKWCCYHSVNVNKCSFGKLSPILIACEHGHTEIVKMLLDKGADYNVYDICGRSLLLNACGHGHTEIVKMLLYRGVDYNKCDGRLESPVMKASEYGHTEIVKMLLNNKADYNKCDNNGQSPLMKACEHGHKEIVKMLLDRRVEYNRLDCFAESSLMKACEHGHTVIVKMLLDRGADYNNCEQFRDSPITCIMKACEHGHSVIVKMLLDRGADCDNFYELIGSPLIVACKHGHIEIVKMLLHRGADCNNFDKLIGSPLIVACKHGHIEIVKMLVDRGADKDKCDWSGQSSLILACEHGHTEIVKMLLDKGADYNRCDMYIDSPLMKACINRHTVIVKMLLDKGADYNKPNWSCMSPLYKAYSLGHIEIVKMFLDKGADYNKCEWMGLSPLRDACLKGRTEMVKMFLDRGLDCNECDRSGESLVMKACEHGHTEIVKMLLDSGADYNKCDNDGGSPLMKASKHGHTEILQMLLDRRAEYNEGNRYGRSPQYNDCFIL